MIDKTCVVGTLLALALSLAPASQAAGAPRPRGKLVDLGGHRLHVYCTGKGRPTVVVENGLGDFSFGWTLVQQRVEKFTRICTYDRAGYAWSDRGPKPRTLAQINLELHDALAKLGERAPFVLVGHSFGGLAVRNYALTYPKQVAGIVFVDTIHEDQRIQMGPHHAGRIRDDAKGRPTPPPRENLLPSDTGKLPALPQIPPEMMKIEPPFDKLPAQDQQWQLWAQFRPEMFDAEESQREWSGEYMAQWHAAPQAGSLGSIPLVVLTRADGGYGNDLEVPAAELERERKHLQADLAKLSTKGKEIVVHAGHNMQLEAPDSVAAAIQMVVEESRKK